MPDDVGIGSFKIRSLEDGTVFQARLADQAAVVTDGYGGWEAVPRPRTVAITEWKGRNHLSIEIPFMIDFYVADVTNHPGADCENMVSNLEKLAGLGGMNQPPVCKVDGFGAIPHDYTQRKKLNWVVDALQWDRGIEIRRGDNGRRMRCGGTVTVRQFLTAKDLFYKIKPKQKAVPPRVYRVKRGDTLAKLARKFYGDPNLWKRIADANHMRDRRKLKVDEKLKIPRT